MSNEMLAESKGLPKFLFLIEVPSQTVSESFESSYGSTSTKKKPSPCCFVNRKSDNLLPSQLMRQMKNLSYGKMLEGIKFCLIMPKSASQ